MLYDVSIWNDEGEVIKKFWGMTCEEVDDIREKYQDEPGVHVVIDDMDGR